MLEIILTIIVFGSVWLGQFALWQRKEYRMDRMKSHIIDHWDEVLPKVIWWGVFVIFVIIAAMYQSLAIGVAIIFGLIEILRSTAVIASKGVDRPDRTMRMVLCVSIFLVLMALISYNNGALGVLIGWASIPLLVGFSVITTSPIASYLRHQCYKKARAYRHKKGSIPIIGITGSYGKTTTKDWMSTVLEAEFVTNKTQKNQNTEIAIARSLPRLLQGAQVAVAEIGAYKKGEIKLVCTFLKPDIGIITALDDQHLYLFGSKENQIRAKTELLTSLPEKGLAIMNHDVFELLQDYPDILEAIPCRIQTFGIGKGDISAHNIHKGDRGVSFDLHSEEVKWENIQTTILNEQWLTNLLPTIIVARHLQISEQKIREKIKKMQYSKGVLKPCTGINGSIILDDSYNCTPAGFLAALNVLDKFQTHGRKFVITRNMLELGKRRKEHHRVIGKRMGEIANGVWLTKKAGSRWYNEGLRETTLKKAHVQPNPYKLISQLKKILAPGDVILIENRIPGVIIKNIIELESNEALSNRYWSKLQQASGNQCPQGPDESMEPKQGTVAESA